MKTFDNLSIFATTKCNFRCPLCACQWLMKARPDYEMTLEQLDHFIARCEQLDVYFAWAWFTGGEPTLWPHLVEGIRRLDASPCFGKLRLNTNGAKIEDIEPVLDMVANVRMSVYDTNAEKAAKLAGKYKIGFWSEAHRKLPDQPIEGGLPAPCICPIPSYFDGRLYVCPGAYGLHPKLGLPLDDPEISCSVDDDFISHYEARFESRRSMQICRSCISNGVVYQQQKPTEVTPVNIDGVNLSRGRS